MSLISRFFGKTEDDDSKDALVANAESKSPLSLQLLFDGLRLDDAAVTEALRSYHLSMREGLCEIVPELNEEGKVIGLAGWGEHVIKLVGFDCPMPAGVVENCVAPSHYPAELKERARAHSGHVLLYYAGYEVSLLEQYVALAAVAGVLSRFGAIVILNESAHTSFPAAALFDDRIEDDRLELLRTLPLPILYCGFVKYEVEGIDGVWMRTHGAHLLNLPDLATLAKSHDEGQRFFDLFNNILRYVQSGAQISAGHTAQVGKKTYLRFRAPTSEEYFLESEGTLLVAELIRADQINR